MSFRNHVVLRVATVSVSCRGKLLMQNLILADVTLIIDKHLFSIPVFCQN